MPDGDRRAPIHHGIYQVSIFPTVSELRSRSTSKGSLDVFNDFWYSTVGGFSSSGRMVNKEQAMRLSAVAACVMLISADIAALPLKLLKERKSGGTDPATAEDLYYLLHDQPNPEMTSFTWREYTQGSILLSGNKYNLIQRDRVGRVKAIWPIRPERVQIKRAKGFGGDSTGTAGDFGGLDMVGAFGGLGSRGPIVYQIQGESKPRPADEILHIPGFGWNGLTGESIITNFARESIGNGLSMADFQSTYFKQGFNPSGFFKFPHSLGENAGKFREAVEKRFNGVKSFHTPMTLEDGGEFEPFKISFVDAQFLELLRMSKEDISGVFHVPPAKIGIYGKGTSYNNTEQQNKMYLDNCILSWLVRDENAMNIKLLTPEQRRAGFFIKYNFDALLRPDSKNRAEMDWRYWQMGVPLNVMRKRDDLDPVPGGDIGYIPLNFIPADQAQQPRLPKPIQAASRRQIEHRATSLQAVAGRDRVVKRFYPLFRDVTQKIVNREALAIKRQVKKLSKERSAADDMRQWLENFYAGLPGTVQDTIGPTFRTFAEMIQEMAANEIGTEIGVSDDLQAEINDYIDGFTDQYVKSSLGQLTELLDSGELADLESRVDEWHETRADKVANRQTVSMGNMVAASVFFSGGFRSIWTTRGPSTCPYCRTLEGKAVGRGEAFAEAGSEISVSEEGKDPMPIYGMTLYPQLHDGCDCFLTAG